MIGNFGGTGDADVGAVLVPPKILGMPCSRLLWLSSEAFSAADPACIGSMAAQDVLSKHILPGMQQDDANVASPRSDA